MVGVKGCGWKNNGKILFVCILLQILRTEQVVREQCQWKRYSGTAVVAARNQDSMVKLARRLLNAKEKCDEIHDCKVLSRKHKDGYYTLKNVETFDGITHSNRSSDVTWIRTCPNDYIYRKINVPLKGIYYEPITQGSVVSAMKEKLPVEIKSAEDDDRKKREILGAGRASEKMMELQNYQIGVKKVKVPKEKSTEGVLKSWCTYTECDISPRTYLHAVSLDLYIVGFTNDQDLGTIFILDRYYEPRQILYPSVEDKRGVIAGVYGFHDGRFAVALFVNSDIVSDRRMYLQLYRNDSSVEWTTELHSALGVPDRNVGDFRLTYGDGYFAVYFSVFGISNFARGTNGDQLSFVNEQGKFVTNSYRIPGQNFVGNGFGWGCSHSLGGLVDFHPLEKQFLTVCASDLFPRGIAAGDPNSGTLLFGAKAGGDGYTSAQVGQIAHSNFGWKLLFNAMDFDCCEGKGIGMISIYNERDDMTGYQSFEDVVWITKSRGIYERDPVIARYYPDGTAQQTIERYLVGWRDLQEDTYLLATIDTFGSIVEGPIAASFVNTSMYNCTGNCFSWGDRDDSFQTNPDGSVGWISAYPEANSISIYKASSPGISDITQWTLWSGWALCSQSCDGGETIRIRECLQGRDSTKSCPGPDSQNKACNTNNCIVPITCTFSELAESGNLVGNLLINQMVQFAYSKIAAEEKCAQFRDLCWGYSAELVNGFPFFVLKTSRTISEGEQTTEENTESKLTRNFQMNCKDSPGWSKWSSWYACSVSCGGGTKIRSRFCDGNRKESVICQGEDIQLASCKTGRCPIWGDWATWSGCSMTCDEGNQVRSRICVGDYPEGCSDLKGSSSESRICSNGVCPYWSDWTNWSSCDKTCGNGTQSKSRECKGDFACPIEENYLEQQYCNVGVCQFWHDWEQWSSCSVSCGKGGIRQRSRKCGGDFPEQCIVDQSVESETCSVREDCPKWSEWTPWTSCSETCDNGIRRRLQTCSAEILETCDTEKKPSSTVSTKYTITENVMDGTFVKTNIENCSVGRCSYWEDWGTWQECSATCDAGFQVRSRSCFGDFPEMCKATNGSLERRNCVLGTCGAWDEWSPWSICSQTCGVGNWRRTRTCVGDFKETCKGDISEVVPCDIGDCVSQCQRQPCSNGGHCRFNAHLARQYHCDCPVGWIGKHCDYAGPSLKCYQDRIEVEFDGNVLSDELLVPETKYVALSGFTDAPECISQAFVSSRTNNATTFSLTVPTPLDISCGSDMEIGNDEIRIKNRVEWLAEDGNIEARVIILEFTCVYKTASLETAIHDVTGLPLKITTFKRSIDISEGSTNFEVEINIFRDPQFLMPIRTRFGSLLQLAEGQIIYVSVDLEKSDVGVDVGMYLVMNTCFVTSSDEKDAKIGEQKPILYLLKDRCPVSPFVTVISNGEGASGLLSVRIFGWTGRQTKAENLYLHCTVEICQENVYECKPVCDLKSNSRRKRQIADFEITKPKDSYSKHFNTGNVKPYPSLSKRVNIGAPKTSDIMTRKVYIDVESMVSVGPFVVTLNVEGDPTKKKAA